MCVSAFSLLFPVADNAFAQTREAVSAAEVNGTFRTGDGDEIKILSVGKGKLRVAISAIYTFKMADGGMMANTGEADGTATIEGDTAIFKTKEFGSCAITLHFLAGRKIRVTQAGNDSDCGFGQNVTADGLYKKVSSAKPKFDER